mmetsp:Transcript_118820/g.233380  ORF Transcript_118820/g.233380 Transcript_118820/m.233380 type:complete len:81 (-) Transcript_118820:507-749(-)
MTHFKHEKDQIRYDTKKNTLEVFFYDPTYEEIIHHELIPRLFPIISHLKVPSFSFFFLIYIHTFIFAPFHHHGASSCSVK